MNRSLPSPRLVFADDLTGAMEVAGLLAGRGRTVRVFTAPNVGSTADSADITVINLAVRDTSRGAVPEALQQALVTWGTPALVKIDSLLRGPIPELLRTLVHEGCRPILVPALPRANRTIFHGKPYLDGVSLTSTNAWRRESRRAPEHLRELTGDLPARFLSLEGLRGAPPLGPRDCPDGGLIVADSQTHADVERVLEATAGIPDAVFIGSGGIAEAIAERCSPQQESLSVALPVAPVLCVIGSASSQAAAQIRYAILADTIKHMHLPPDPHQDHKATEQLRESLQRGPVIFTPAPLGSSGHVAHAEERLAAITRAALHDAHVLPHLFLSGGSTAEHVLQTLGVTELIPLGALEPGMILSRARYDERWIHAITRPGSFGSVDSLSRALNFLPFHQIQHGK